MTFFVSSSLGITSLCFRCLSITFCFHFHFHSFIYLCWKFKKMSSQDKTKDNNNKNKIHTNIILTMHLNEQEPHLSIGIEEETFNELRQQAIEARSLSYSPYSHFKVGCCLLTKSNDFIKGANIENASYGCLLYTSRCV